MTFEELAVYSTGGGNYARKVATIEGYVLLAAEGSGLYLFRLVDDVLTLVQHVLIADMDGGYESAAVWQDGTYFYILATNDALNPDSKVYSAKVDKGKLVFLSDDDLAVFSKSLGFVGDIDGDDTYGYCTYNIATPTNHLVAFSKTNGAVNVITELNMGAVANPIVPAPVFADGTYIYTCLGHVLRAYTFNGAAFNLEGSLDLGANSYGLWAGGGYIFVGNYTGGLRALTFDGTTFTLVNTQADRNCWGVWGDWPYVYVADEVGMSIYTFDGADFQLKTRVTYPGAISRYVSSDDFHVFLSAEGGVDNFRVFKAIPEFSGSFATTPSSGPAPLAVKFTDEVEIF